MYESGQESKTSYTKEEAYDEILRKILWAAAQNPNIIPFRAWFMGIMQATVVPASHIGIQWIIIDAIQGGKYVDEKGRSVVDDLDPNNELKITGRFDEPTKQAIRKLFLPAK